MAHARTATAVRFEPEIHEQLVVAAGDRGVSINFLVNEALRFALPRMVPRQAVQWFSDDPAERAVNATERNA